MCNRPMGVENGRIRNAQITASSEFNKAHAAFLARLNRKKTGGYIGAWAAAANNYAQWLKVDFGRAAKIVRVSTQGRQDADQWVTTYYLSYSIDCVNYVYYRYHGSYKVRTQQFKEPCSPRRGLLLFSSTPRMKWVICRVKIVKQCQ